MGMQEEEPIESSMITKSLETAQKRIEGFNFDSRKQVLAYDDVMNTQRLAIYARRRGALLGSAAEVEEMARGFVEGNEAAVAAFDDRQAALADAFIPLLRRLLLQLIDAFWLEHLETMEYLRRSVSLRAYGQRDPLIEYRREGLARFRQLEADIAAAFAEHLPRVVLADETRIRAEEEKVRTHLQAVGSEEDTPPAVPIIRAKTPGRNDTVTIRHGAETKTLKYKKAEPLLALGWELVE